MDYKVWEGDASVWLQMYFDPEEKEWLQNHPNSTVNYWFANHKIGKHWLGLWELEHPRKIKIDPYDDDDIETSAKKIERSLFGLKKELLASKKGWDDMFEKLDREHNKRHAEWEAARQAERDREERIRREEERQREEEERRAEEERVEEQRLAEEERQMVEVPNEIDPKSWYSHALLLAQPGAGKTNAIRWRIVQLIPQIREGRASLIVLDPKGVLTHEMLTLARAQGLEKRTIFIDPIDAPVSVNLFDRGDGSPRALNETIARVTRVLGTITSDLTPLQRDALTFTIRALFSLPDAPSIPAVTRILRQGKQALPMDSLPSVLHDFFEYDFQASDGRYIIARLNSLLSNPIFETLFSTDRSNFDILKEMQAGKLIVINAGGAESLYGRFWIEEIARTIRPRLALPDDRRMPTTFLIDEAPTFIAEDRHFAEILDQAREAKIGILIAAQHMDQIKDPHVRSSLYNCVLKFVARTNADIHNLSRSMGMTEPDFLGTIPQYQFAFFGPNMDSAVRVKLPLVEFARARQEDIDFFRRSPTPPEPPPAIEPSADVAPVEDLALADAYAQLALAIRRQNTARAAELQDHISSLLERQRRDAGGGAGDGARGNESSNQRRSAGSRDWR